MRAAAIKGKTESTLTYVFRNPREGNSARILRYVRPILEISTCIKMMTWRMREDFGLINVRLPSGSNKSKGFQTGWNIFHICNDPVVINKFHHHRISFQTAGSHVKITGVTKNIKARNNSPGT